MAVFNEVNMSGTKHFLLDRIVSQGEAIGGAAGVGNPLGLIVVVAVAMVAFILGRIFTFERGLAAASFVGSVISFLLVRAGLLSSNILYIMGILLIVSIFLILNN